MGGVTLGIDFDDSEVRELFRGLKKRIRDMKPAMKVVGEIVRSSIIKNFEEGGRPKRWKSSKRVRKRGGKTLIKDSHLMKSIKAKASSDRVEIGTSKIYAAIHQFGGKAGRGHKVSIPARPFIMIQKEDLTEIGEAIADYITGGKN